MSANIAIGGAPLDEAIGLYNDRQLDAAYIAAARVIAEQPRNRPAHALCGKIDERLGKFAEARSHYLAALAIRDEPGSVRDALERVTAIGQRAEEIDRLIAAGQSEQALALLDRLVLEPTTSIGTLRLAEVHYGLGQLHEATEQVERFLMRQPGDARGLALRERIEEASQAQIRVMYSVASDSLAERDSDYRSLVETVAQLERAWAADDREETLAQARWLRANGFLLDRINWADDIVSAKAAHFAFANDLESAAANFHPLLIEKSVAFGYISWPRHIQQHVQGAHVLDVGCGFGGSGAGFLVAGATSYVGVDPAMPLDSQRTKDKRRRSIAGLGMTPREIMAACPAIRLLASTFEQLVTRERFDVITLHNVTEHLINIRTIIPRLRELLTPDGLLIYHHHNFFGWNGHHMRPSSLEEYDSTDPNQVAMADWNHILTVPTLPADHYCRTRLNHIRLDELRSITEAHYAIESWEEQPCSDVVASRLTAPVLAKIRSVEPGLTRHELTVLGAMCTARSKP